MSFSNANVTLRKSLPDEPLSRRYIALFNLGDIPVFCACLIAMMGSLAGFSQVVKMQFSIDADTEGIEKISVVYFSTALRIIKNNFIRTNNIK